MTDDYESSLRGQLLLAMPGLQDPNFSQTVTCISEHNRGGALGLVINRVHPTLTGMDIFEELQMPYAPGVGSVPIHLGGPVHLGEIFILHGPPFGWHGCLAFTPELALSTSKDVLEAISLAQGPKDFLISVGCAGWGVDQLESEIKQNAWLTCPANHEILFEIPVDARWEQAMSAMGINPVLLSDDAGHA
jgi:putative transcriptional regulator